MHPLDIKYSSPLEREYEAWIIQGIEDYFNSLGQKIAIWAVSPSDEVNWPADEHLIVGKKLIGLQLKKVTYKDNRNKPKEFGRLNWTFHNPKGQFQLVLKFPEIFYCLPTFINRDYRSQAIQHCLFWRPEKGVKDDMNAWYDNSIAQTPHKSIYNADRWGLFIEKILSCKVGKRIGSIDDAKTYVDSIRKFMLEPCFNEDSEERSLSNTQNNELIGQDSVYLFALPYKS